MFKEQDNRGKTPYDLGLEAGKLDKGDRCPYEEGSDAYDEFYSGYYDADSDDDEEDNW